MSDRYHGGTAFPVGHSTGMTLRQYYAGQALLGLLSSPRAPTGGDGRITAENIAQAALAIADALLALERR